MVGLLCAGSSLHAQVTAPTSTNTTNSDYWELMLSPYAYHFDYSPEHKNVYLVGLEKHRSDQWFAGGVLFSNSFGQATGAAYAGYEWDKLFGVSSLYAKLAGGIMYGYVGQYKNKVPLNYNGWSPIVVPAVGWSFTQKDAAQVTLLGNAGLLFSYNRKF
ncbi:hypothetical protein [Glaciimonas soli]|uniref:Sn-glycerol-3-phosphate transporter n=1 Tax=Glaciimonas soli TaxID=2590999 RepID=A0A843YHT4_9BURK|nr:hypothetical protein [Glaciimonas soli]MQQ99298.1 hypothetical protein [Glaciimonas soli]